MVKPMHSRFKRIFLLLLPACFYSSSLLAGGPLVIEGPAGHTPVSYANPNIVLNLDQGMLGIRNKAQADLLIEQGFALWNNVSSATIQFTKGTDLSTDINISNFTTVLPNLNETVLHEDDGLNPIVYDTDGSIIDAFFGSGASNNTIGFAASIVFVGSSDFVEGYAVFNGRDIGLTNTEIKLLIAHELGHFAGLDHTQANINNSESFQGLPPVCSTSLGNQYPVMYPFVCRDIESLHADDISAVSALYPSASFNQQFGQINGFFTDAAGNPIVGTNLWAENVTTGEVVSTVSDYLENNNGFYQLFLPPGNYTLHANSINPEFTGGSGIGPYTANIADRSFQFPHPISDVIYQGGTPGSAAILTVVAGQITPVNFASNGGTAVPVINTGGGSGGGGGGALSSGLPLLATVLICVLCRRRLTV
ncbi:MAG TPA: hypothetical protein ENJ64_03370 [Thiotrichales bacterium]|nr:hypothetical protein [Thiotrichales bacterium]